MREYGYVHEEDYCTRSLSMMLTRYASSAKAKINNQRAGLFSIWSSLIPPPRGDEGKRVNSEVKRYDAQDNVLYRFEVVVDDVED